MDEQGAEESTSGTGATEQPIGSSEDRPLTLVEETGFYIDLWKQSVDVQMHFNDIEWRIRGLALTVATFALGAAGLAAREGTRVGTLSLGVLVLIVALLLWYAFYFVDRTWYHPLLKGSVDNASRVEKQIQKVLPAAGMTQAITRRSVQEASRLQRIVFRSSEMHSDNKLAWFYGTGAIALLLAAVALQIGLCLST